MDVKVHVILGIKLKQIPDFGKWKETYDFFFASLFLISIQLGLLDFLSVVRRIELFSFRGWFSFFCSFGRRG